MLNENDSPIPVRDIKRKSPYIFFLSNSLRLHVMIAPYLLPYFKALHYLLKTPRVSHFLKFTSHLKSADWRVFHDLSLYFLLWVNKTIKGHRLKDSCILYYNKQSMIGYFLTVWGGACKSHLVKLERAQRAVLQVSRSLPFLFSTKDLY